MNIFDWFLPWGHGHMVFNDSPCFPEKKVVLTQYFLSEVPIFKTCPNFLRKIPLVMSKSVTLENMKKS